MILPLCKRRRAQFLSLLIVVCFFAQSAMAADQPAYGPPPAWVRQAPLPVEPNESSKAAVRMILQDYQLNFSREGVETYTHAMVRVQTPQGLASVGTLALPWKPDSDVLTVHYLHILRGDQVVDVLGGGQTFTVLRRENNLEYAALDGVLTATVQPSGLQVGDIIDLAYTIKRLDPVLAGTVEQVLGGWQDISLAHLRVRAQWPSSMPVRWKSTDALGAPKEARRGDMTEVSVVLDHLEPLTQPEGAPLRFRVLRQIEFSDFKSWAEVSARLAPLYEKASILAADSPLHAEIAKIKKQSENPITRAEGALAALRLRPGGRDRPRRARARPRGTRAAPAARSAAH